MSKEIIVPKRRPYIVSSGCCGGKMESEGPLCDGFDYIDKSDTFGKDTFEKAESEMQKISLQIALQKCGKSDTDLDAIFSGDLTNQCVSSNYGLIGFDVPFFGLYGACSTCAEGLVLSAITVGFEAFDRVAAITSSHNCTAERQFRYPLEYGGQHAPTSQWTVTGSGAFIVEANAKGPYIADVMPGKSIDKGIKDINNMGAGMAPAVIDTLVRYFKASGKKPDDFGIIATGDLGFEGHRIVKELMKEYGYDMYDNYTDCGLLIYNKEKQDVHAGGSGCGCSASVLSSLFYPRLCSGELKDMLFIGTGALMSPSSIQQGLSIPGVAHLVHIVGGEN